jgi:hypothetical protein
MTGNSTIGKVTNFIASSDRDPACRGISGPGSSAISISDVLISVPNLGIVDGGAARTYERISVFCPTAALFGISSTGLLTIRDSIFAGAGEKFQNVLTSGISLENCGFGASGSEAIGSKADGGVITSETGSVDWSPVFKDNSVSSATLSTFMDVQNYAYKNASSTGGDLAGGGDYIGGALPNVALRDVANTADISTLVLPSTSVGNSTSGTLLVKNNGPGEPLDVNSVVQSAGNADFAITADSGQAELASGQARSVTVTFTPQTATASITGQIDFDTNSGTGFTTGTTSIGLSGDGTGSEVRDWNKF